MDRHEFVKMDDSNECGATVGEQGENKCGLPARASIHLNEDGKTPFFPSVIFQLNPLGMNVEVKGSVDPQTFALLGLVCFNMANQLLAAAAAAVAEVKQTQQAIAADHLGKGGKKRGAN